MPRGTDEQLLAAISVDVGGRGLDAVVACRGDGGNGSSPGRPNGSSPGTAKRIRLGTAKWILAGTAKRILNKPPV